ncbi:DUF5011 domain-containing protein [Listeria booriae]|nr:DUF5011 domain-containing protein [Listeria booriae]MBC1290851.1 DUF5011 domain-containing protein [Listeria booriae]MBC1648749.1 DUF5011 domain-containing protein [Listeria booriae]MBC1943496.1 DUF5011 domain-containing protein [Listeria booriae]MBC6165998.1 DUF5011 domain-containing protein [Listeria booriae]
MGMNGKMKVVATLATAGVLVVAPVTAQLEGGIPSIQAGSAKVSAATINVLKDSKLAPVYENGKLKLTLTGQQLAQVGLISTYYTYFALPDELASLLNNPNIRANTTLDYDIPTLAIGPIGLPSNKGTLTGDQLKVDQEHQAIGGNISHGLASIGIGATNTYTLTINLANLGVSALPPSNDGTLEFAAMSSDRVLDINLLGNPEAAQTTLATGLPDSVKPVIDAQDVTLYVGDEYDPKQGVTATDDRDGDVTNLIQVTANDVDTSQAGTYHVTYSVKDTAGNVATKTITVTVAEEDFANYQVGNVTAVNQILPGATTIEGQTDYNFYSKIPEGTDIYAEAVFINDRGFSQTVGRSEIKYGIGTFKINANAGVNLAAGNKVLVYLLAINGDNWKKGPIFTTFVSEDSSVSK